MLNRVVEHARARDLDPEPGFAPKNARWAVLCTASGDYLGIVELGDAGSNRNPGRQFPKAPDFTFTDMKAGGVTKSHFLIETAGVVACYGKDAPEEKHRYFTALLEQASEAVPGFGGAAKVLRIGDCIAKIRAALDERKAKPTDKVTFMIDGEFPLESDAWHEWWREFRRGLQPTKERSRAGKAAAMLCFLTGEAVEPAPTHPKITGLTSVGGLAMGDVLIGFKQESFRSYGLEQSANAAMSELAAKAYQAGLNDLIANHSVLLAGTRVVHWFRGVVPQEEDPLSWLDEPCGAEELNGQMRARRLLESIRAGERPDLANNTYYSLTLSSNGGRVVIRDWVEGSFEALVGNVNQWFLDLEIERRDGSGMARPPKLAAVLAALVRDLKDLPPPMAARLFRVAASDEPIPVSAMAQALARARIDVIQGARPNHARIGLIKAYHARKWRHEGASMAGQLKPEVNADLQDRAYHCGRLMAVLGKLQTSALGDVGAGIIQRYYAAASTTPALVFGRLIRGAQFHLNKLAEKRGLAVWYERQMSEICAKIGTSMPSTLNLEEQSLFALGYYQQLAAQWAAKGNGEKEDE